MPYCSYILIPLQPVVVWLTVHNENHYASTFGGLRNPQGILTNNNKPTNAGVTEEEKERRCNQGGVRGKCILSMNK
jgi:hypothetical protein